MKTAIHPQYNQITVTCSCGSTFLTGSTKPNLDVDICAKCHPFFTGEMRFVDQLGRVEKFRAKQKAATGKKAKKDRKGTQSGPKTLTDIRAASAN
ncbi:50S ribosomal protein L31 [Candidatus Collierbacteria bacterium CG10_big_fil_rev_8_21_14_0_10_44_9]|uniref:Large ribosomal subunit protein bL31 n=1 Tax=Candidatus Collierbacteria bacterium CG10_big_fil_rev_8_21_14_0_10_44_9 TaxID=1974535 RepID=A0A2H0VKN6_9BACT|nr:MAG: 50S ribosomal protein L31 [Candidatus Collierbacteria bacterium CG10_big_fil_rev_8_21_14_0_10_44_9]